MKNYKKIYFCVTVIFVIAITSVYSVDAIKTIDDDLFLLNVEALSQGETGGAMQRCRCHDDNNCYGGNAISFRKICFSESTNNVLQCSNYSSRCN